MPSVNHSFTAFRLRVKASKASSMLPSTEHFSFLKDFFFFFLNEDLEILHHLIVSCSVSPQVSSWCTNRAIYQELFPGEKGKKSRHNCDFHTNPEAVPSTHTIVAHVTCSTNASQTSAEGNKKKSQGRTVNSYHINS